MSICSIIQDTGAVTSTPDPRSFGVSPVVSLSCTYSWLFIYTLQMTPRTMGILTEPSTSVKYICVGITQPSYQNRWKERRDRQINLKVTQHIWEPQITTTSAFIDKSCTIIGDFVFSCFMLIFFNISFVRDSNSHIAAGNPHEWPM